MFALKNKKILVTGFTGFLGEALTKKILKDNSILELRGYARDEYKISELERKLQNPKLQSWIGDIRDLNRLKEACEGVDIIIHCAALKRIDQKTHNAFEVIDTNVRGTKNVMEAGKKCKKVIVVSTDKAFKPENLYGASKFCAEGIALGYPNSVIWRFGNYIDSRGSVFEIFREQRDSGVPLTICDPDASRFVIDVKEVCDYLLSGVGYGLHYPKNLKSMTIKEIADSIAPGHPYIITGLREGEKKFESFNDNYTSKK